MPTLLQCDNKSGSDSACSLFSFLHLLVTVLHLSSPYHLAYDSEFPIDLNTKRMVKIGYFILIAMGWAYFAKLASVAFFEQTLNNELVWYVNDGPVSVKIFIILIFALCVSHCINKVE